MLQQCMTAPGKIIFRETEIPEAVGAEVKIHSKRKIKEIPFYGDDIIPGNALFRRFVMNPDTKAGIRLYEKNK